MANQLVYANFMPIGSVIRRRRQPYHRYSQPNLSECPRSLFRRHRCRRVSLILICSEPDRPSKMRHQPVLISAEMFIPAERRTGRLSIFRGSLAGERMVS